MKPGIFPGSRGSITSMGEGSGKRHQLLSISRGAIETVQAVTSQNQDRLKRGEIGKAQRSIIQKRLYGSQSPRQGVLPTDRKPQCPVNS